MSENSFHKVKYYYPNNLEDKTLIFFWTPVSIIAIGTMFLIGCLSFAKTRNLIVLVLMLIYAILSACFPSAGGQSVMGVFMNTIRFVANATWWRQLKYDNPASASSNSYTVNTVPAYDDKYSHGSPERALKHDRRERSKNAKQLGREKAKRGRQSDQKTAGMLALTIIVGIACICFVGYTLLSGRKQTSDVAKSALKITYTDNINDPIEWGGDNVDPLVYVKSSTGKVTADPKVIDVSETGDTKVTYTITSKDGKTSVKQDKIFTVADSIPPEIKLKADNVTITQGDAFDPKSNIASVKDPKEGLIDYADTSDFGKYTIASDVNANVPGNYTVTVTAIDYNGNQATATYQVAVNPKQ